MELVQHYLMRPLEAFTPKTVTDPTAILERLERFREDEYGWVYEGFAEGINSIAAPILDKRGAPIGAIHVHGPSFRFPGSTEPRKIAKLLTEEVRRFALRSEIT